MGWLLEAPSTKGQAVAADVSKGYLLSADVKVLDKVAEQSTIGGVSSRHAALRITFEVHRSRCSFLAIPPRPQPDANPHCHLEQFPMTCRRLPYAGHGT
jgi:hypothetical protein